MKKLLILLLSASFLLSGCGQKDKDLIEVTEKYFIEQCNDVYYNPDEYIGKSIKLEGLFDLYYDVENEDFYYYVIRYGPGCCGDDANVGFEVVWDDEEAEYPETDEWVEAVGVVEYYEAYGYDDFIRLRLTSLKVLDERGNDTVSN